jgi:hypothetical protein
MVIMRAVSGALESRKGMIRGPWIDWETLEWRVDPRHLLEDTDSARQMGAAPELLGACEAVLDYWESDPSGFAECEPGCDCIVDQLRAAIAKARQENE